MNFSQLNISVTFAPIQFKFSGTDLDFGLGFGHAHEHKHVAHLDPVLGRVE